jgi:hypothetical protein
MGLFGVVFIAAGIGAGFALQKAPTMPFPGWLFGLPFVVAGAAVLVGAIAVARKAKAPPPVSAAAAVAAARFGSGAVASSGPLVLRATSSRIGRLAGMVFICLFWNGITGVFTVSAYGGGHIASGGTFIRLFLIPFQIIGLLIAWGMIHAFLSLFTPRPTLTLARDRAQLGHALDMQWRLSGATSRIQMFRISLIGTEEARFRRGTDTVTDTHEFYRAIVVETSDRGRIETGMVAVTLPRDSVPSLVADNNKIIWALEIKGDVRWWPDVDDKFEIQVTP